MLRLTWIENTSNEEFLKKFGSRKIPILKIRKEKLKIIEHIMRKDCLESLIPTRSNDRRTCRGKQGSV